MENYYCENCFKEDLDKNKLFFDDIGSVFCSQDCLDEYTTEVVNYNKKVTEWTITN